MGCKLCSVTARCDNHEFMVIVGLNEKRWRALWAAWAAAFVIAETCAIRSGDPTAPLSHHTRKTLRASESKVGALVLAGAAVWLIKHLYENNGS